MSTPVCPRPQNSLNGFGQFTHCPSGEAPSRAAPRGRGDPFPGCERKVQEGVTPHS